MCSIFAECQKQISAEKRVFELQNSVHGRGTGVQKNGCPSEAWADRTRAVRADLDALYMTAVARDAEWCECAEKYKVILNQSLPQGQNHAPLPALPKTEAPSISARVNDAATRLDRQRKENTEKAREERSSNPTPGDLIYQFPPNNALKPCLKQSKHVSPYDIKKGITDQLAASLTGKVVDLKYIDTCTQKIVHLHEKDSLRAAIRYTSLREAVKDCATKWNSETGKEEPVWEELEGSTSLLEKALQEMENKQRP